jgi:serine/threonine-protein kinase RsbW
MALYNRVSSMINGHTVRLDVPSAFDMIDVVQVVGDAFARGAGLDDDAIHWVGLALRESVVNAMRHGNGNDRLKRVHVELATLTDGTSGVCIRVRDEGPGFDPNDLPDPLAPENLLKSSGRGIFLIRSFMDELIMRRAAEGGMEMVMVKRTGG